MIISNDTLSAALHNTLKILEPTWITQQDRVLQSATANESHSSAVLQKGIETLAERKLKDVASVVAHLFDQSLLDRSGLTVGQAIDQFDSLAMRATAEAPRVYVDVKKAWGNINTQLDEQTGEAIRKSVAAKSQWVHLELTKKLTRALLEDQARDIATRNAEASAATAQAGVAAATAAEGSRTAAIWSAGGTIAAALIAIVAAGISAYGIHVTQSAAPKTPVLQIIATGRQHDRLPSAKLVSYWVEQEDGARLRKATHHGAIHSAMLPRH